MQIFSSVINTTSSKKVVLTIGNFDGLHIGHQKILRRVISEAKKRDCYSAVMTFSTHPRKVIFHHSDLRLLNFVSHKLTNLERYGIDRVYLIPFNEEVRNYSKDYFLENFIRSEFVAKVIVGYDFHYGKNREGTIDHLKAYCRCNGILFEKIQAKEVKDETVSSSRIRVLVKEGNLKEVQKCLGRPYSLLGKVVKGSGIGGKMGIRTANLRIENEIFPPDGVYFVRINHMVQKENNGVGYFKNKAKSCYVGLAYKGPIPEFNKRENKSILEVFLYGFSGDLYGEFLEVSFLEFVRKPQKVTDINQLEQLIKTDIEKYQQKYHF